MEIIMEKCYFKRSGVSHIKEPLKDSLIFKSGLTGLIPLFSTTLIEQL